MIGADSFGSDAEPARDSAVSEPPEGSLRTGFARFLGVSVTLVVTSAGLTSLLPDRSITLPLVLITFQWPSSPI